MECSRPASDTLDALELLPGEAAKERAAPASGTPECMSQRRAADVWAPTSTYGMRRGMRASCQRMLLPETGCSELLVAGQRAVEGPGDRKR